jgi:zinc protease
MNAAIKLAVALACAALASVALAACGSDDPEPTATPSPAATPGPATSTPTATPVPTATATATATPVAETATPSPTATPVSVPTEPDALLPFDEDVVRGTLSNGLTYYIKHNQEPLDRAYLALVVRAGSILEEEEQRGLAHFVEHMAFNGTERFEKQEIVDYLESIGSTFGADLNASTGFDTTQYFLEIPTDDPEILETAFQILSDWAYAVTLSPEEVELERDVILEEWRLFQGFSSRWQESFFPLLFGTSRYVDRAPIGLLEVIETAPVEQLRAFYERWYRPDLMAVIAVGDFDVEEIEAKVKRHFAPPPEGEAYQPRAAVAEPTDRPRFEVPGHDDPRIDIFTDPEAPGTQLILVVKAPPDTGQDVAAFQRSIARRLAFMMINARLFERGQEGDPPYLWAGGDRSSFVESLDIVTFSAVTAQDAVEPGFDALLEEMQRVAQHGFTETELAREKVNLLSSAESVYKQRDQLESSALAGEYSGHFLTGIPVPGVEAEWAYYQALLPRISLAEVDAVAASWSEPGNTVVLVLRPENPDSAPDGALAAAVETRLVAASTLSVEPYEDTVADVPLLATLPTPGSITAEERIESVDAERWTLSNGITVIAKQTDFKNDEVLFGAFSPGGHSIVADEDHVSALHAAALVDGSGAGLHDSVTLDKLLAGKRVAVSPYIGELFEGLSGSASPEDLETLFQLITLYVTEPRLDPDFYSTYVERLRTTAETRSTQPDAALYDTANSILAQHHFRRRILTLDLLDELSMERAEAVYADRFADMGDATFVFVGAFDRDELRSLSETYLASLPTSGRVEQYRDWEIDPPAGIEEHTVRKGIEPRSQTILVYAGDTEWSRNEALTIQVAGEMLQIRLRERLREELGGTYFVNVNGRLRSLPDHEYQLYVIFGSDPNRVDELGAEVAAEVEWLRAGGEQRYLDTVKELLRSSREEQLRENSFWLGQLQSVVQLGESFAEINGFDARLEALTLEDVVAAARRYLLDDQYVRVVLFPEEE